MALYTIGDLHLSESSGKPMDVFGGVWQDYRRKIVEAFSQTLQEDDTVVLCGDLSWGLNLEQALADFKLVDSFPGKKILIKGNHDLWWSGIKKLNTLFDDITFMQNDVYMVEKIAICGTRGWICPGTDGFDASDEKIYKRELLRLEASLKAAIAADAQEIIGVMHYSPTNDKKQLSGFTDLFEKYGVKEVVFGHLHGHDAERNKEPFNLNGVTYRLVSLDGIDADPVKLR